MESDDSFLLITYARRYTGLLRLVSAALRVHNGTVAEMAGGCDRRGGLDGIAFREPRRCLIFNTMGVKNSREIYVTVPPSGADNGQRSPRSGFSSRCTHALCVRIVLRRHRKIDLSSNRRDTCGVAS